MIIIIRSILFLYQIVYFDGDPEGIFIIVSNGLWGIMLEKTFSIVFFFNIYDALHDLVPFVQFKKRENIHGRVFLLI